MKFYKEFSLLKNSEIVLINILPDFYLKDISPKKKTGDPNFNK